MDVTESLDIHSEEFIENNANSNPHDNLIITELIKDIDIIIANKFPQFKKVKKTNIKRVNKDDVNVIYSHVKNLLPDKYNIVDVWYYLSDYFDMNSTRFYECLKDEYKLELISYLYSNTTLLDNKNLNKLF